LWRLVWYALLIAPFRPPVNKKVMPARAATTLNRILRVTANLLFEKGEDPSDVARFLGEFADRRTVNAWHQSFCETNGVRSQGFAKKFRRLPMPPIDFEKISLESLQSELGRDDEIQI